MGGDGSDEDGAATTAISRDPVVETAERSGGDLDRSGGRSSRTSPSRPGSSGATSNLAGRSRTASPDPGQRGARKAGGPRPASRDTEALLRSVVREKAVGRRHDLMRQGEEPRVAHILLDGYVARYRMLSDGRRQISAVVVPGDICDLEAVMRGRADFSVGTLTRCTVGEIPADRISPIAGVDAATRDALLGQLLRDEAIAREWLVGLGRRTALERIAHLFCELWLRLRRVGLLRDDGYELKIRQGELADALGLSTVHVNRVLQELRRRGLIRWTEGILAIIDYAALVQLAEFEPFYLAET